MRINLQVGFVGGVSKTITANAADMVAFENKFNVSVGAIGQDPRMGYLLFLAWHSEKRNKATSDDYEKWLETVESIGASDEDPKSEG